MIPLQAFIEILMEAHDRGLDFIDIVGTPNEVQDIVGISYDDTYFSEKPRTDDELYIEQEEGYDPPTTQDFERFISLN